MKPISNKTFFTIIGVCLVIIIASITIVKVDSTKYLTEKQITKSLNRNIKTKDNSNGYTASLAKTRNSIAGGKEYYVEIWDADYNGVMEGLRNSFYELSKKKNTQYTQIIISLNDARREKGYELVDVFLLEIDDLYSTDWTKITTYEEFKKICNIE